MTKDELVQELSKRGWRQDSWGHMHKVVKRRNRTTKELVDRKMRVKMQARSARVESQVVIGDRNEWIKIGGGYLKDCAVLYGGETLQIGTILFKKPSEKKNDAQNN